MTKYTEIERELAQLMRPEAVVEWFDEAAGELCWVPRPLATWEQVPRWAHDDFAAFGLVHEHHLDIEWNDEGVVFVVYAVVPTIPIPTPMYVAVDLADHPDHGAAARYAIVKARIAQIKRERGM
jgi:hypothetical protein